VTKIDAESAVSGTADRSPPDTLVSALISA
jgi:hypothetical protein